jgi:RNA polymerase sigma-70 factor (ECF subfamily)
MDILHKQTQKPTMQAIDAIYQQYAPAVFRFAYGLCGDAHLANDLVAETFVRAMLSSKPIGMETVRAYLCMIARRLYLKEWHRRRRHTELEDVHFDGAAGPEQLAIDAQALKRTLAALQDLSEIDRTALLMRADDAVPYEDIARALDISLSSAKVKVFRARLKLTKILEEKS